MDGRKCIQTANHGAGGSKQKGIITYGMSANRLNPLAGVGHAAVFNTFRRTKSQIFYWLPVMVAGYYIMHWATERYVPKPNFEQLPACSLVTSYKTRPKVLTL
jgi:hypothetical protein